MKGYISNRRFDKSSTALLMLNGASPMSQHIDSIAGKQNPPALKLRWTSKKHSEAMMRQNFKCTRMKLRGQLLLYNNFFYLYTFVSLQLHEIQSTYCLRR